MEYSEPPAVISRAEGFLFLGMFQDALNELDGLDLQASNTPAVLRLRMRIYARMKRWEEVRVLGQSLLAQLPPDASPSPAPALVRFRAEIYYRVACAECQRGEMRLANDALERALNLNTNLRLGALEDPDLEPIWNWYAHL